MCVHPGCHCNLYRARSLADYVPTEFVEAMGQVLKDGLKNGRKPDDWQDFTALAATRKLKNLAVHLAKGEFDSAACNVMFLWWTFQRRRRPGTVPPGNPRSDDHAKSA